MPRGGGLGGGLQQAASRTNNNNKNRQAQRRSNTSAQEQTSGASSKYGRKHGPMQSKMDMAARGRSPRKRRGGMAGPMETMGLLYEMYMGAFRA